MKKSIIASLLIACSLFIGGNTDARAEYPYDKPINIIVPFGPGGGVDIAARILADYFQQNYNITINVVNKPGGAQAIGINEMLRARPDGYTLAFPGFSALATTPKLTNVGYTLKNIKPVAHIASMECVLSTNKSSGIDTWEKFLQAAEKNPDGTVYGTTGSISTQRLYMTKLTDRFHGDLKIRHTACSASTSPPASRSRPTFCLMPTPATSTSSPSPARNAAPICPIRQPSANCTPTR